MLRRCRGSGLDDEYVEYKKKRTDGMKLLQKLLDQGVFKHVEGGNLLEDSSESFYTFQKIIE